LQRLFLFLPFKTRTTMLRRIARTEKDTARERFCRHADHGNAARDQRAEHMVERLIIGFWRRHILLEVFPACKTLAIKSLAIRRPEIHP
jgi:hypothetical protein